jgi:hypothetical protein
MLPLDRKRRKPNTRLAGRPDSGGLAFSGV